MWQLGRDTSHVPPVPNTQGGQLETDRDLEGQSRGMAWPACKQFLAILQVCDIVLLEKKIDSNSPIGRTRGSI